MPRRMAPWAGAGGLPPTVVPEAPFGAAALEVVAVRCSHPSGSSTGTTSSRADCHLARLFMGQPTSLPEACLMGGSQRRHVALAALANVLFQLGPILTDDILDDPAGSIGQTTNGGPRHGPDRFTDFREDIEILPPALAAAHPLGDLQ